MDKNFFKKCLLFSSSLLITICVGIVINFILQNFQVFGDKIAGLFKIMRPILYGVVMAYLLNPVCKFFKQQYNKVFDYIGKKTKLKIKRRREGIVLALSIATSIILVLGFVILIFYMIIPQIVNSIPAITETITNGVAKIDEFLQKNQDHKIIVAINQFIMDNNIKDTLDLNAIISKYITPYTATLMQGLSTGTIAFVSKIKDICVGLFVAVYILSGTKRLSHQAKMILYGVVPKKHADFIMSEIIYADEAFNGFLVGKIVDSIIIGAITYVSMLILHIPYAPLIAVIIGATNIIPVFGPFIGAIPPTILLLLTNPIKAVIFVVFILILQQIDGNVIGPKIIGKAIGISSLWILVSIIIFGGLFGILGMIIGVPLFAVIYDLIKKGTIELLKKKGIKSEDLIASKTTIDDDTE